MLTGKFSPLAQNPQAAAPDKQSCAKCHPETSVLPQSMEAHDNSSHQLDEAGLVSQIFTPLIRLQWADRVCQI
jgi:hypothetical protein